MKVNPYHPINVNVVVDWFPDGRPKTVSQGIPILLEIASKILSGAATIPGIHMGNSPVQTQISCQLALNSAKALIEEYNKIYEANV